MGGDYLPYEENPQLTRASRFTLGCVLVAGAFAGAIMIFSAWLDWDDARGRLPETFGNPSVIEHGSEGGLREGCSYAAYRLEANVVQRLRSGGVDFLRNSPRPAKEHSRNPYSPWYPTPLELDDNRRAVIGEGSEPQPLFALGGTGCRDSRPPLPLTEEAKRLSVHRALSERGSFYSVTANGEGLIVVDSKHGLAWYLYFG